MSDNLSSKKVVLFGVGKMGVEYSKVLQHLGVNFAAIGRSEVGVEKFYAQTAIKAIPGGFSAWKEKCDTGVEYAIVAVSVEELAQTTISLMDIGVRKILLEKPAGLNAGEIKLVKEKAKETGTKIIIAYNRRFYASVLKAQEIIKEDGGVKSFNFEFTEWTHQIPENIKEDVKKNWFLANSTHVVDLAFFLSGEPKEFSAFVFAEPDWHSSPTVFAGAGITKNGALFSYQANWFGPGRWGVEVITNQHRLIFRPLEKLQVQLNKSVVVDFVEIDDKLDRDFKPGLFKQTEYFLKDIDHPNFLTIDKHYENVVNYYQKIVKPQ
ncbi:MAG: Gfo/Idh/MocA family oxidoreductase [Elusimicrobiota bacterium]